KDLLKTNLEIADIAQIVGFSSQGHLNYHFKRLVGITPKAFLRR
ncbi:AraC family transcriptional regulator, partial [Nostoc sp. CCCryo 231-06]|nr:AraC family transcriptional regulator [Nostoc sp. CCCryo 231-06]